MNKVLFMQPNLQTAVHKHTFCMIHIANSVTIATQSSVFIKKRVNWLLGNQNKGYAHLVLLL